MKTWGSPLKQTTYLLEWQTEYWYADGMDGGEQREKDLAEDLEEQGCKIEWQEV